MDGPHRDGMIDDPVLPAAAHLTGPHAGDVVGAAVAATGSELVDCRPVQVQYRPGSDLVVRYKATVRREDGSSTAETLLAGCTKDGPHPGTVPVEAVTDTGDTLVAGVWRWPFDPVLADLDRMVTPAHAAEVLDGLVRGPVAIDVVVYRPVERVVARVTDADGRQLYVKLVAPGAVAPLAERHRRLADAGLPVPEIVAAGDSWIAMTALAGPTLRDVVKRDALPGMHELPTAASLLAIRSAVAASGLDHMRPVRPRVLDAAAHARMLATVLPQEHARLLHLADRFDIEAVAASERSGAVVHGDLHEGQLIVDGDRVVGLLDVDDAGPGDPVDDLATLLGHLTFRSLGNDRNGAPLRAYASSLRSEFAPEIDPGALDTAVAGVLVGLATGPFRIQQPAWQDAVGRVLDEAESILPKMKDFSESAHRRHTDGSHHVSCGPTPRSHTTSATGSHLGEDPVPQGAPR